MREKRRVLRSFDSVTKKMEHVEVVAVISDHLISFILFIK